MKRLMGDAPHPRVRDRRAAARRGVRRPLRGRALGVRIGSESYSLKQVEKLYMDRPAGEVMDGGGSIVAYEEYLERRRAGDARRDRGLQRGRLPLDARPARLARGAPRRGRGAVRPDPAARGARRRAARGGQPSASWSSPSSSAQLLRRARPDDEQQARWLLAQMLDWHRRESEARLVDVLRPPEDERRRAARRPRVHQRARVRRRRRAASSSRRCSGTRSHRRTTSSRSVTTPYDPVTGARAGEVMAVDDVAGTIDLQARPDRARRRAPARVDPADRRSTTTMPRPRSSASPST